MTGTLTAAPTTAPGSAAGQPVPRRRWSGAHVVTLAAALVAAVANWLVLSSGTPTTSVLVAGSDLSSGQAVTADDVVVQEIEGRGGLLDQLLTELPSPSMVAIADVAAGEPLRASDLIDRAGPGATSRRMSLPVPVEHAVGGKVRVGDRIDVLAAGEDRVRVVAANVEVVDVAATEDRGFGALGSFHVTVVVDAHQSLCLVAAIARDDVHLVLATGADAQARPPCRIAG